jgi:hypothetical protein
MMIFRRQVFRLLWYRLDKVTESLAIHGQVVKPADDIT